ncbi:hypothetical protein EB796_022288 [Bugula neritina]|uniref:Uncharacterized protein n=1 Tax=Bugula neritina TaxID=10212 RepID=A0A7J7J1S7_BUGNE|nr:hypothetical protein EB796_022288 [Bugula neritina]
MFSDNLNVGVMEIENLLGPAVRSKLYTFADTNEYVFIDNYDGKYGGNCTVDKLNFNDFAFPFRVVNGQDKLVSGKDVLLLGGTSAVMDYLGNDTINDVDVDVWNGCIYIKNTDMTLNATYYFSVNNTGDSNKSWQTASGMSSVIKRIHVIQDNSAGTATSESVYEYAYFSELYEESVDDLRHFEPPLGAYCKRESAGKKVPEVPDYFSLSMELHDPQQQILIYTDEWYDFKANLSRVDYNTMQDRSKKSEPVTVINDYDTAGVAYKIHRYTKKCEIDTIDAYGIDDELLPGSTGDKKFVRIRTPKEFFNFDDLEDHPWIYSGTCEVWISKRPYPTRTSSVDAYWEWYFTNNKWVLSNGDVLETLEPFRMVVTVPDLNNQITEFNVYRFNQEPPDNDFYDISSCFDLHEQSRSYEFVMNADVKKFNLESNIGMLKYWTTAALEAQADVRAVRIHGVEFEFDETKVFTRFTILGVPNIKGDVPFPVKQVSLDEAEGFLNRSIGAGKFLVYYLMRDGKETQFQVDSESFVRSINVGHGPGSSVYYVIDNDGRPVTVAPGTTPASSTTSAQNSSTAVNSNSTTATPSPHSNKPTHIFSDVTDKQTPLPVTAEAVRQNADVAPGGAAATAIILFLIGIVIIVVPFYIITVRRRKLNDFSRSQLTMSELHD